MLKRISSTFILSVLLCFVSTGCSGGVEVDDDVYAVAVGLDKGVNNKLILTIEYPTYKKGGGEGQSGGSEKQGSSGAGGSNQIPGANIHTIETPSLLEGLDIFNMAISRRISMVHVKLLVISEELAREGVGDYIGPLSRYRGTRNTLFVLVTRGKAVDFIKENKSNIGESLTKSIELMEEQSKKTGFFPDINLHEFYRDVVSSYSSPYAAYVGLNDFSKLKMGDGEEPKLVTQYDFLPGDMPRVGVAKREFVGTAVFDGDKMVGSLNPTETRYMLLLKGKVKSFIVSIEDKNAAGKAIVIDVSMGRAPSIKTRFEEAIPVIDIELNLDADLESVQSRLDYEQLGMIDELDDQIKDYFEKGMKKTLEKTQNELKSDVFGFGAKFAGYFTTIQEWEDYNWLSHYQEAKINTDIKVNVRRTGLTLESPPIFNSEGKK